MSRRLLSGFGQAVRRARLAKGLSQEALAAKANLHRTYVGAIERGERNVSLINIGKLAVALSTTPATLLADAHHDKPK
jgi:transcriptional regulator with XRE-family HTH domain